MRRIRRHLTYANVMVTLLAFIVLAGGAAYAANTVFSTDIVDGEVKTPDIAQNAVATGKIGNNQVFSDDVRDDTLAGGGLAAADLRSESVGPAEAAGLTGADIANAASGSDDVNADTLDGLSSRGLVQGRGKLLAARFIMLPNDPERTLLGIPGFGRFFTECFGFTGRITFTNTTNDAIDFWVDGVENPHHQVVPPFGSAAVTGSGSGNQASTVGLGFGDDPGARRTATVHSFVAQAGAEQPCVFQAQAILWTSG